MDTIFNVLTDSSALCTSTSACSFNSSDHVNADEEPRRNPHAGKATIERMRATAAEDRLSTKKYIKGMKYSYSSPGTRKLQDMWVNRFDSFRQNTLVRTGGGYRLQNILAHAAQQPQQKIVWTYPNRPVLAQVELSRHKLALDKPAGTDQVNDTIKRMGVVSDLIGRVHSHALRSGAARDIASLPKTAVNAEDRPGFNADNLKDSLGHSVQAAASGLSRAYAGNSAIDFYAARAAAKANHKTLPKFAIPGVFTDTGDPVPEPIVSTLPTRVPLGILSTNLPLSPSVSRHTVHKPQPSPGLDNIDPRLLTEESVASSAVEGSEVPNLHDKMTSTESNINTLEDDEIKESVVAMLSTDTAKS
ncbi:hypothetical protein LTR10_004078 [Elasticomyces elasticus]|nr:hypothetical protein LTR10_004078 [Elasticomyces elasticus]KAK4977736.1 hypothetical protein LTR42_002109 [Elasticomyces elasticus]